MPRWIPIPILILGGFAAWGLARGRPAVQTAPYSPPPPLVEVVEVKPRDLPITVRTHGIVDPRTEIDLVIEVAARVRTISPNLAAGGRFEEGEVLVELDPTDAQLVADGAEADLARAENQAGLSDTRWKRLSELSRNDVVSASQLDESDHARRIARAQVRKARATLGQARRDLERTRVRAPFTGRVRAKHVDVGQFVSRGTVAGRIYGTDAAEIRLPIPSSELRYLAPTDGLGALGSGLPVRLRAQFASRAAEWTGRVVRSEGEIAARSRMLHLVARVDDPEATGGDQLPLAVGLFVDAEILGPTFEGVYALPPSALRGDSEVLVVGDGERLEARRVDVLRVERDRVLIRGGLSPGERVAVSTLAVAGTVVRAVPAGGDALASKEGSGLWPR